MLLDDCVIVGQLIGGFKGSNSLRIVSGALNIDYCFVLHINNIVTAGKG